MKKVSILASENCVLSTIASPMDMLLQAGVLWNIAMGEKPTPLFDVKIVTTDGQPITALNKIPVIPACAMHDVDAVDLIIIPSQGFFYDVDSEVHRQRVAWLSEWYERGADLASICAGAFTLAATGLLDGRMATTHWALANQFRKLFPAVKLRTDLMMTEEDRLFCSGGITADTVLSLYLIERYCGRELALQGSRCMLVDFDRTTQAPFATFIPDKDHGDSKILQAQKWMDDNYKEKFTMNALAGQAGMSLRQFNRRFKSAAGESAVKYLQHVRVDAAKTLLATTQHTFDELSPMVGYENVSFFRRVFKNTSGLSPVDFRRRFGQPASG